MGISGLLPLLKSIQREVNLKKFDGKTLGVDAYGWLHRGTTSCALELAQGKPTRKFVDFAMHRVRMLQHFGVTPFLIFDGDYLPSKAATEADRNQRRENHRRAGQELLKAGKTSQAFLEFQKAVDVTPEMARQLIDDLKKSGVQYIVAPYEADAQMAYLERKGVIDGIISEDSDLLVFGAKILLTKLDQYGNCVQISKADFSACKEISLTGWSEADFRRMAILSGCDYLASINNMGLKTAYRMVRKHKTIEKVIRMLQFDGKFHVPKNYLEAFNQAELTFLHQRVYCPTAQCLVFNTTPESGAIDGEKMAFIGADVDPHIAQGVAKGDLNPMTKKPIVPIVVADTRNMSPWPPKSENNLHRSASTNDLKKGVSIETFFRKRMPLAELDPNCFTPSPQQLNALARNSGPWMASPALVPRPYLNRSVSENVRLTQSAPRPARQAPVSHSPAPRRTHPRSPTISEPRHPKRVRLCADIDPIVSPSIKVELGASRFFASAAAEPSPMAAKTARRRSKKQDVLIYSDDSIEDAMLGLADVNGFETPSKTFAVTETSVDAKEDELRTKAVESQDSCTGTSQDTLPSLTMSSSVLSLMEPSSVEEQPTTIPSLSTANEIHPSNNILLSTINSQVSDPSSNRELLEDEFPDILPPISKIREQFAFKPTSLSSPNPQNTHGLSTPPSAPHTQRQSRIPLPTKATTAITAPKSFSASAGPTSVLTPLQRLGANAAGRSLRKVSAPNLTTPAITPVTTRKSPRRSLLGKGGVPFPDVAHPIKQIIRSDTNQEGADTKKKTNTTIVHGSEDLIIHDSEGEDEGFSPRSVNEQGEYDTETKAPKLDFGRFAYKG